MAIVTFSAGSVSAPSFSRAAQVSTVSKERLYRLVDLKGEPHPVLDGFYDSLDAAWSEALQWWTEEVGPPQGPVGIGIEVSTTKGSWRTLRHPGC